MSARSMRSPETPTQWSTALFEALIRPLTSPASTFFLSSLNRSTRILRINARVSLSS